MGRKTLSSSPLRVAPEHVGVPVRVEIPDFGAFFSAYLDGMFILGRREYDRRRDKARLLWCDWTWTD